jgi:hypothetical protein
MRRDDELRQPCDGGGGTGADCIDGRRLRDKLSGGAGPDACSAKGVPIA